ncbi:MAG TPA: hypothetical protein VNV18_12525 [Stellaceae bacterium]|nr:hypothetical protein [Stellaceae bacterium]
MAIAEPRSQPRGYVVDVDRARIERAPRFASADAPDWSDRAYTDEITKYWLPPV